MGDSKRGRQQMSEPIEIALRQNRSLTSIRRHTVRQSFPQPRSSKLDPRFLLALIRQESVFKPLAKSPAGARGLLQLTIDAAQKYATNAGMNQVQESQLYQPETSIRLGSEYLGGTLRDVSESARSCSCVIQRW